MKIFNQSLIESPLLWYFTFEKMLKMNAEATTPSLDQSIEKLINTGRFQTKEDVLREGVRLIEAEDEHWAELDAILIARADDPDMDDFTDVEEVFDRLNAKYKAMLPAQ